MQRMCLIGASGSELSEQGHELVLEAIDGFLARGPSRAVAAWGPASPPLEATVSGSPRLVLGIAGRNHMAIPQAGRSRLITLRAGELVCIDRRAWNHPLHSHAKCFLTIDCKRDRIRYYLRRTTGPGSLPATGCISWVKRPPAACTQHLIRACEELLPRGDDVLLRATVACLLRQYRHELIDRPPGVDEGRVWLQLCDWIDEHLHEDIDRAAVARARGIHPNHVSRLFRRHAGRRFVDHLQEQRLARAKDMLAGGDLPIAVIAARCGFARPEYFSAVFKRSCGLPPGGWRRAQGEPSSWSSGQG